MCEGVGNVCKGEGGAVQPRRRAPRLLVGRLEVTRGDFRKRDAVPPSS